ncbi:MAG: Hydroxymethylglutaryl-CoA lyase YngG [Planctomycetota bacterium]
MTSQRVRITEVGPRDGLQNERRPVPTDRKVAFVDALSRAGFPEIEVSSFVNPARVPQLADAAEVFARIERRAGTVYSALVPNERGLDAALAARVDKVAVFAAASEGFSRANTGASIADVLDRLAPVVRRARSLGLPVRGYVSCIVRCPYDGPVALGQVRDACERILDLGVTEVDLGETLGVAQPDDIRRVLGALGERLPPSAVTLHVHDTNGQGVANALAALEMGVRSFDSSAGGLGGCPFAPGARGNVSTDALVQAVEGAGYSTGVDRAALARATASIVQALADAST